MRGLSSVVGQWLDRGVDRGLDLAAERSLGLGAEYAGLGAQDRTPEAQSLADRLREAVRGLDPEHVARRAQEITDDRLSQERAAREKELALEREREAHALRRGIGISRGGYSL